MAGDSSSTLLDLLFDYSDPNNPRLLGIVLLACIKQLIGYTIFAEGEELARQEPPNHDDLTPPDG